MDYIYIINYILFNLAKPAIYNTYNIKHRYLKLTDQLFIRWIIVIL